MKKTCKICSTQFVDDMKGTNGRSFTSFDMNTGMHSIHICKDCCDALNGFIAMRIQNKAA